MTDISHLADQVARLRTIKQLQSELKIAEAEARAAIEEALGDATEGTIGDAVVVRRKRIETRRLDHGLLAATVGEQVIEECKTVSVSTRFEIVDKG